MNVDGITFSVEPGAESMFPETEDIISFVIRFACGDRGVYPDALADTCERVDVENTPAINGDYNVAVYPEHGGIVVSYSDEDGNKTGYVGTLDETITNTKNIYDHTEDDLLYLQATFTLCVLYRSKMLVEQLHEEGEPD